MSPLTLAFAINADPPVHQLPHGDTPALCDIISNDPSAIGMDIGTPSGN